MKKTLAIILALAIITLSFASCSLSAGLNSNEEETIFVVSNVTETRYDSDCEEYNLNYYYEYDSYGKLIKESGAGGNFSNYEYDNNGNVVKKTSDNGGKIIEYLYNENNNVVEKTEIDNIASWVKKYNYEYDDKNNIVKVLQSYFVDKGTLREYEREEIFDLTYVDGLCTQAIVTCNYKDIYNNEQNFKEAYLYAYDENNNLFTVEYYFDVNDLGADGGEKEIDGQTFYLYSIRTYHYDEITVTNISNEVSSNETGDTTNGFVETTTELVVYDNYGFMNIDANGDVLVSISGYNFGEGYVVLDIDSSYSWTFTNGNYVSYEFSNDGEFKTYNEILRFPHQVGTRNIISNDIAQLNIPYDYTAPWSITDRVVSKELDTVIVKARFGDSELNEDWFVLEKSIDKDRPLEKFSQEEIEKEPSYRDAYKLYLKS